MTAFTSIVLRCDAVGCTELFEMQPASSAQRVREDAADLDGWVSARRMVNRPLGDTVDFCPKHIDRAVQE
jgi:hypothetical protein